MNEAANIVRRERVPESVLYGPSLTYSTITTTAVGGITLTEASNGRYVLSDPYVNGMQVRYANIPGAGNPALIVMIRLSIVDKVISQMKSDIVILDSQALGGGFILPIFGNVYSVVCGVVNAAGSTYPTNVGYATSINFF